MYSKTIMEHFTNPQHVGEMKDASAVGEEGNMKCGDVMYVYIKVEADKLVDVSFQTYGCVAAIAASDMVCELAIGKRLDDALQLTAKDVINALGEMPPIKFHCSILGIKALQNAIRTYRGEEKKETKTKKDERLKKKVVHECTTECDTPYCKVKQ